MSYAVFGPFDKDEAEAVSTTDPMECINGHFNWAYTSHLEIAGLRSLHLGGAIKSRCKSHHFGGKLSTMPYSDAEMILCQIDEPLAGIYVCSEKTASIFCNGLRKLIDEKLDPESIISRQISERKREMEKAIELLESNSNLNSDEREYNLKIKQSWVFNSEDTKTLYDLKSKCEPKCISEAEMKERIENFYSSKKYFGRSTHIGMAFYYFGFPVDHLVQPSIKERLKAFEKNETSEGRYEWIENYFREDSEKRLFGTELYSERHK